eukprot:2433388-Pyramimonas_sp.AAC.1
MAPLRLPDPSSGHTRTHCPSGGGGLPGPRLDPNMLPSIASEIRNTTWPNSESNAPCSAQWARKLTSDVSGD